MSVQPTLSYISSVDISTVTNGTTSYNFFYPSSNSNVVMFEYRYKNVTTIYENPGNIVLGYIRSESSSTNGIQNSWTLVIPVDHHDYDQQTRQISVRVYLGMTESEGADLEVSEWSNPLTVHVPPTAPVISKAFFDTSIENEEDLYVLLEPNDSPADPNAYDNENINYMIAYYYTGVDNTSMWKCSNLLSADLIQQGTADKLLLKLHNFGRVSSTYQVIYVAVYAVYTYPYEGSHYYSVSQVSNTYDALPTSYFIAPVLTSIEYNVYTGVDGSQSVALDWDAPVTSAIDIYTVQSYNLYMNVNGDDWILVETDIPSSPYTYSIPDEYAVCGNNLAFAVQAVTGSGTHTDAGTLSPLSNSLSQNVFKYSSAVQGFEITQISRNNSGTYNLSVSFTQPLSFGCGTPDHYELTLSGATTPFPIPLNQNASPNYTYSISDVALTNGYGDATICLVVKNTNSTPSALINGPTASQEYVAVLPKILSAVYNIYESLTAANSITMALGQDADLIGGHVFLVESGMVYSSDTQPLGEWLPSLPPGAREEIWDKWLRIENSASMQTTATFDATDAINNGDKSVVIRYYLTFETQNGTRYSLFSEPISRDFFTYSEAVIDLAVNVVRDENNLYFDYSFQEPINFGLGSFDEYTIQIRANVTDISKTKTFTTTTTSGRVQIAYDQDYKAGTFTVTPVTIDTNSNDFITGHLDNVHYIWTDIHLDELVYNIYTNNTDNTIDLTMSSPLLNLIQSDTNKTNYSVAETIVFVKYVASKFAVGSEPSSGDIGNLPNLDSTNNWTAKHSESNVISSYNYDATNIKNNSAEAVIFLVASILEYDGKRVMVYSNIRYINYFEFPTAPQNSMVNYAAANTNLDAMDVNYVFENSASKGVHSGTDADLYYRVDLKTYVAGQSTTIATKDVPYDSNSPAYNVNFDNVKFSREGHVKCTLVSLDTNSDLPLDGPSSSTAFVATALPQITKQLALSEDLSRLTCEVVSIAQLAPYGTVLCVNNSDTDYFNFNTMSDIDVDIVVIKVEDTLEEGRLLLCHKYTIEIVVSRINTDVFVNNSLTTLSVANSTGTAIAHFRYLLD